MVWSDQIENVAWVKQEKKKKIGARSNKWILPFNLSKNFARAFWEML